MGPVGTRPRVRISECPFTLEHSEPRLEHFECLRRPLWMFHVKQIAAAQHPSGEVARPSGRSKEHDLLSPSYELPWSNDLLCRMVPTCGWRFTWNGS